MTGALNQTARSVEDLLTDQRSRGVLIAASRDPDAKLTFVVTTPRAAGESVVVKIPTTMAAGGAVEHEGRILAQLSRRRLGPIADTIPRYVEMLRLDSRPVLVSTAMTGTPMSVGYHRWLHTARPSAVKTDFGLAADWLNRLQSATAAEPGALTWAGEVAESLSGRWDGHPALPAAIDRLVVANDALSGVSVRRTAVHGDFWFGNVLVNETIVSGVVDWEAGAAESWPLCDIVRFALSYSLYLDRHTRPGHRVIGHRVLRRVGFAPGIVYALLGRGWFPEQVRSFLAEALSATGVPASLWYAAALTGIGEVAATANDDSFGAGHLMLLAGMPLRPDRHAGGFHPRAGGQ
jgi:Phosphotransferase enzyme family